MSLTLITAMTSLRVLIGVAGVGYSFFVNKDTEGNFDYGEIPKSIFGETVGGIFYDWLKHGTSAGYDKFLQSLDSFDADALNHDLQRAARKATLLATYFACQACLADIKSERHSIWKRVKNVAWKDEDINWLVAVSKSLRDEIKNVETETFDERINYNELLNIFDKDSIANPKTSQKEFADKLKEQTLQDIKNGYYAKFGGQIAVPFSQNGFDLLSEAINNGWENFPQDRDFTIQLKLTSHGNQVKKYDWFHLVCVIFNEEYKVNEKIEAAMQKHTALEQTALLKQISNSFESFGRLENFHDLERQIEDFREENFVYHQITHEKLNEILNLLRGQMRVSSQPLPVHNLPSLTEKVYGREMEKEQVFTALNANGKRFSLIVAPSGFGKTRLLAKVLQDVTDGRTIKSEYAGQINRIMLIDCRLVRNLTDITNELNTVLGTGLIFENKLRNYNEAWCKLVFELIDGMTLLFLDNFEAWLDASDNYQLVNVEIRAFLNALFTGNHGLRGVCLSQSEPESDVLNNLNKLREVGAELFKGLDRESALLYLRENANADNGLGEAPESLLVEFLEDVSYIPQALNSLIGYLDSISGYTFADFMDKENGFWAKFDEAESDETAVANGIRRTKALIKQQILQQSDEVKLLLMALAFFARPVPREALELLFPDKAQAANPISRLTSHNLATVTTGIRGTKYYVLHAYFREQTRNLPPRFEDLPEEVLTSLANIWLAEGNKSSRLTFYNRAITLFELSEQIFRCLVEEKNKIELANDLAGAYMNKGNALASLGRLSEAVAEFEKAIEIREELVKEKGQIELANDLAAAYLNKGVALKNLGGLSEAVAEFEKAIGIFEELVKEKGRIELAKNLAAAYMNRGLVLEDVPDLENALVCFGDGISWREKCLARGDHHVLPDYVKDLADRVRVLIKIEDWRLAAYDVVNAFNYLPLLESPEVPDYFKQRIGGQLGNIIRLLKKVSPENREEIYKHVGEMGEEIRRLVEEFSE